MAQRSEQLGQSTTTFTCLILKKEKMGVLWKIPFFGDVFVTLRESWDNWLFLWNNVEQALNNLEQDKKIQDLKNQELI